MKFSITPFILLSLALFATACTDQKTGKDQLMFYVGSSDTSLDHPIFLCRLDYNTQKISVIDSFAGSRGSSYLALSTDHRFLYAIDKGIWDTLTGEQMVSAFRVDPENYRLEYLNSQSSGGAGPCHIHCNSDRSYIFAANYGSGSVAAFPLSGSGEILPASDVEISTGSGPNKSRQRSAHTHYVSLDPDENFLLSPDLGTDRVLIFRFDKPAGNLFPNPEQPFFQTAPGAGPRHLDFHPSGKYLYIVNELNGTLTACRFEKDSGSILELNTLNTLPDEHAGPNGSAAVRVHPNGKFVYASNRGDMNSIAAFRIQESGSIERIQVLVDIPAWPRDFNLDPKGRYLFVAGERSDEIEVFRIDIQTGMLSAAGEKMKIKAPGNILFIEALP